MSNIPQPRNGFADVALKTERLDTDLVKRLVAAEFENVRADGIPSHLEKAERLKDINNFGFYRTALDLLPEIQSIFERSLERVMYGPQFHAVPSVIDLPKTPDYAWYRFQGELPVVQRHLQALQDRKVAEGKITGGAADAERGIAHTFTRHYRHFGGKAVLEQATEALIAPRGAAVAAG